MVDKVLQFEVWNECNNACTFCSNKYVYDISAEEKIQNLQIVKAKLADSKSIREYSKIGLIGGEFFQGQLKDKNVKSLYLSVIDMLNLLLDTGKIKEYWTTATLIAENQDDLFEHLDHISDKSKVWICTSYDTSGRFHTSKMLESWKNNMKKLKTFFPEIHINTTTILTGDFIEEYLTGKFSIHKFTSEFDSTWFSKPPMLPSECTETKIEFNKKVNNFFPTRKRFLEFLLKFKMQESDVEYDKLFNTQLRADALIKSDYTDHANRMVIERNKSTDEEITLCIDNEKYANNINLVKSIHNDTSKNYSQHDIKK